MERIEFANVFNLMDSVDIYKTKKVLHQAKKYFEAYLI